MKVGDLVRLKKPDVFTKIGTVSKVAPSDLNKVSYDNWTMILGAPVVDILWSDGSTSYRSPSCLLEIVSEGSKVL
jgi:hypothetical protein